MISLETVHIVKNCSPATAIFNKDSKSPRSYQQHFSL